MHLGNVVTLARCHVGFQRQIRHADEVFYAQTQLMAGRFVGVHHAVGVWVNPVQRPGVFHNQAVEQQLFFGAPASCNIAKLQHHTNGLARHKARHDGALNHPPILELHFVKALVLLVCPQRVQTGDVLRLVPQHDRQTQHQLPLLARHQQLSGWLSPHFNEFGVEILGTAGVMNRKYAVCRRVQHIAEKCVGCGQTLDPHCTLGGRRTVCSVGGRRLRRGVKKTV